VRKAFQASLGDIAAAAAEPGPPSAPVALGHAAAFIDLAAHPETLGHQALALLHSTGAAPEIVLATGGKASPRRIVAHAGCDARRAHALAVAARGVTRVSLGTWRDQPCELVFTPAASLPARLTALAITKLADGAVRLERARREARERTALWPVEPHEATGGAIFASRLMTELAETAYKVAPTGATVLIAGETGTGKEVLAQLIHRASPRADKPFVPFNCNAVPRDLVDAHLFGYRRGAFTGAHADSPGVIRAAAGGTLLLDEIGELSLDVQPKLLRFLESSEILPLGESRPIKVNVCVIASTNAALDRLVKEGRFREDLYYRLTVVPLIIPPLRERREEIPLLVEHYLDRFAREYHKGQLRVAEETMEYLLLFRWPGNVRELVNEMRRLAVTAEPSAVLMPEHLKPEIFAARRTMPVDRREPGPVELVVRTDQPLPAALEHVERAMIRQALGACAGNLDRAARALGLSRKGLYLKRRRLGLIDAA
jgi:DNA-binding NtrC family response regulator